MRLAQLYQETVRKLARAGVENAQSDADQLLGFCLGLTRSQLFLHRDMELSGRQLGRCRELIGRRVSREPLHYITGTREFWSLEFSVSPAVLIPRPETEFLLDQVVQTLRHSGYQGGAILDMCTGSGVIAVVLAMELGAGRVVAVDRSPAALQVAAVNIARYDKENAISLLCADLFSALNQRAGFELIVANPPYVPTGDLAGLQPEVRDWEPLVALAAGGDGLDLIGRLAAEAPRYLKPGGWLFMEMGADQRDSVQAVFRSHADGEFDSVDILDDWSGRPRVLKARKKG